MANQKGQDLFKDAYRHIIRIMREGGIKSYLDLS